MNIEPSDSSVAADAGAALLGSGSRVLNGWSMLFALPAVLVVGLQPVGPVAVVALTASLIAALAQAYFALRCAFDAAVFERLQGDPARYIAFDRVLAVWGMRPGNVASRSVDERVRGAMRLLRWQARSFFLQLVLLVIGLAGASSS